MVNIYHLGMTNRFNSLCVLFEYDSNCEIDMIQKKIIVLRILIQFFQYYTLKNVSFFLI